MPDRYKNRILPPVLYTHTMDWVVGLIMILTGVRGVIGTGGLPATVQQLPAVLGYIYIALLLLGGAGILAGLFGMKHFWSAGFVRAGMWLAASAFGVYAVLLMMSTAGSPAVFFAFLTYTVLAVGCAIRAHGVGIDTKANLRALQRLRYERESANE